MLDNATIESDDTVVYSKIDLHIQLIGENKLICTNEEYGTGIYAGDYNLNKDLAFIGDGSLTIEIPNAAGDAAGISAAELTVATDLSSAVRVRGNAFLEEGTTLKVLANPGSSGICKGLSISGDLFLGKDTTL